MYIRVVYDLNLGGRVTVSGPFDWTKEGPSPILFSSDVHRRQTGAGGAGARWGCECRENLEGRGGGRCHGGGLLPGSGPTKGRRDLVLVGLDTRSQKRRFFGFRDLGSGPSGSGVSPRHPPTRYSCWFWVSP